MALIKMGAAARRAGAGSTNTIRRALVAAGIELVVLSPGEYAVEEDDLNLFLQNRGTGDAETLVSKSKKGRPPKPDRRR